jgi:RHS repeat-associated protein
VVATGNADGSVITPLAYSPTGDFGGGTSADFDQDDDVDADDFAHMTECSANGPDMAPPGADSQSRPCTDADLDRDGDVDAADMVLFQPCMSGSGVAPPAGCLSCVPKSGTFTMHGRPVDVLHDPTTGKDLVLQDFRVRTCDVKNARWLQRDPKGYVDGPNLYEAFRGNPLANADLMGEMDPDAELWLNSEVTEKAREIEAQVATGAGRALYRIVEGIARRIRPGGQIQTGIDILLIHADAKRTCMLVRRDDVGPRAAVGITLMVEGGRLLGGDSLLNIGTGRGPNGEHLGVADYAANTL